MTKTKTEEMTAYKKWYQANKERAAENAKAWREKNREQYNAYQREYTKANPHARQNADKKWREKNADKVRSSRAERYQRIKSDPLLYARELELQRERYRKRKVAKAKEVLKNQ